MARHIISGAGAPITAPTALGQHYVDTLNGKTYVSRGTANSTDWREVGAATGTGISFTDHGDVTSSITIAPEDSYIHVINQKQASITINVSQPATAQRVAVQLLILNEWGGPNTYTINFAGGSGSATVNWLPNSAPTGYPTNSQHAIIDAWTVDQGATWYARYNA